MLSGGVAMRTPRDNVLAVNLVRTGPDGVVETEILPPQDALHVVFQLKNLHTHELWLDERPGRL